MINESSKSQHKPWGCAAFLYFVKIQVRGYLYECKRFLFPLEDWKTGTVAPHLRSQYWCHLRASLLAIPFAGELPSLPNPLQDLTPMSPSQWGLPCTSDSLHPALLVPKFLSPSKEQKTSLLLYRVFCMLLFSCSAVSMDCSTPGFPVLHHLPQFAQTHIHWVGDTIQPSHPLSSLLFPPSIFPSIRVFPNESALCIRWPKYQSFSFSISPSNGYSGLISFRID